MQKQNIKSSLSLLRIVLLILCIVFLIILFYFIFMYYSIQQSKTKGFAETKEYVKASTDIVQIEAIERFQEIDTYHIVEGKTKDNIEQIVFVPISNPDEKLTIIEKKDLLTRDEIEKIWRDDCSSCRLVAIKPAMINHESLWELTYYDESNRYVFDYVSMEDGSNFEKIRLQREFK